MRGIREAVITEIEKAKAFIKEIIDVSKRYNLSIGHEDSQGAFLIQEYNEINIEWLRAAYYNRTTLGA